MHPLLQRQLKRLRLDPDHSPPSPEVWQDFLTKVDQCYAEQDQGRVLLERSLDLTSQEMQRLYEDLRRSSESELSTERTKLAAILRSLGDGLCVVDEHWNIVMMNQVAQALFGRSLAEMEGQPVYRYLSPGPEEFSHECLVTDQSLPRLEEGKPFRTDDGILLDAEGQMISIALTVTPITHQTAVTGAAIVFRDITSRKQAEAQREEHARQVRQIQAGLLSLATHPAIHSGHAPEAAFHAITQIAAHSLHVARASIWFFTEDQQTLRCAMLLELPTERYSSGVELSAAHFPRYFSELAIGNLIAVEDAQQDPITSEFTPSYLGPLGITSMLDAPIRSKGRLIGVICHEHIGAKRAWTAEEQQFALSAANTVSLTLEAHDRQQAEQALRMSEARLSMTVKGAQIGIWDWDPDINTIYFSPGWKAQLGFENDELTNTFQTWETRVHPEDLPRALQAIDDYLQHRTDSYELEHRLRHKDGSYRWILSRGALFEDPATLSKRMVGIHIDVTSQKQVEEDLRTAKNAAEAASVAKSQFLANMSHEIRTPMNGVLGLTELLQSSTLSPRQQHLAQSIHQSGLALLHILNDILDFSKIEAGKLTLDPIPFQLPTILDELCSLFAESARRKGLELGYLIEGPSPPPLKGDPVRLRQILVNLLSNAIKFTEQGIVFLLVRIEATNTTQTRLRFEVQDTGIGLPPMAQADIFQPFVQADGSTTRKYGGTGLGLAIVSNLVRLMNGALGVHSTEGQGSTFWFTLTLPSLPEHAAPKAGLATSLAGKRILVVDDTAINRRILAHHLSTWGMLHESVDSGAAALDRLRSAVQCGAPYDVVLLDNRMPEMTGIDVARAMANDPTLAPITRILLTSSELETSMQTSQAGFQAKLAKPIRPQDLHDCLTGLFTPSPIAPYAGHPSTQSSQPARSSSTARILLVEDNPVNRDVAIGMLDLCGYQVDQACNGREAVDATSRTTYDLILMDCQMPEMDGLEATRLIRAQERERMRPDSPPGTTARHQPIIALTAHTMAGDRERCLTVGMDDYLSKPFTRQQLLDLVSHWLDSGNGEAGEPAFDVPHDHSSSQNTTPAGVHQAGPAPTLAAPPTLETLIDRTAWEPIKQLSRPGKPDLLRTLFATYLADTTAQISHLRRSIHSQDSTTVFTTAHRLKSSSATLGCVTITARCAELETMGRTNQLQGAPACLAQMEQDFEALRTLLHPLLNQESLS